MSGSLTTSSRQIKAALNKGVKEAVAATAYAVLQRANEGVPQPGQSRGYAVGALKASGYVATEDASGYEAAIAEASQAQNTTRVFEHGHWIDRVDAKTRIVERDQILPPEEPAKEAGHIKAIVAYPLYYAWLIENGFYHQRAGRHIIGVAFLKGACSYEEPFFVGSLGRVLKGLELIQAQTRTQRQAAVAQRQQLARQAYDMSQANKAVRETQLLEYDELRAAYGQQLFNPEKGQNMAETWERVKRTLEEHRGS
jgi:hypothetical protein